MLPVAEEEMLSPLAPSSAWGEERVFSFAAGVGLAALETHQGANTTRAKKPHQGIFSKNRRLRFSAMWAKWSGTHQDRSGSWWKSVLGSALDANGNTLSDPSGKAYTWDFENRLTQAVVPGTNGGTTTFKYDPFGRRIQKSGPLGTTNYLYDGMDFTANIIEEVDNTGNVLARFTQDIDIDAPLSMLQSGTTSYFERDGLGSVTSLSNSSGALANTYTFDSFGKLAASTGTLTNPFQYASRELDSETALYYDRARYYDEKVGRFISEDPSRLSGGIDLYAYVGNNPITRADPDGNGVVDCADALAELLAATANVAARTAAMAAHAGTPDPMQHSKALGQAVTRLKKALKRVQDHCACEAAIAAEVAAAVAAAEAALEVAAPYLLVAAAA